MDWAVTTEAMNLEEAMMTDDKIAADRFLFSLLCAVCTDKALTIVRLSGGGLKAWRHLCREFEPHTAARWSQMLIGVLQPKWTDAHFQEEYYEWERAVCGWWSFAGGREVCHGG